MRCKPQYPKIGFIPGLVLLLVLAMSTSAFAQGSIFGAVTNSDATVPANGEISFYGFLDDTDEELRIQSSDGAGYDAGNWFDDFQNYGTEAPGNPYDYYFFNTTNGEGFHLAKLIPNNSFQQEDVQLGAVAWPAAPTGFTGTAISSSSVLLEWNGAPGISYHVYRRSAASNGSFFRLDDATGSLANPGVADSFYVDPTVDGVSSYDYLIIADDGAGNLSPHSGVITVNSATAVAPAITAISPASGPATGGTLVTITGSGFDAAGVTVQIGTSTPVAATVVSPYELTATTSSGTVGTADVSVINDASGLTSNTLTGAFTYEANTPPVLATIGDQSTDEGVLLSFGVSASDADGTIPSLSTSALPTGATFLDNGDGTGTFDWTPTFDQAGDYPVTFYATDDSAAVDSELVTITVNQVNQAPVLATIGAQSVDEGVLLSLPVSATDPDGDIPALTATNLPLGAAFTDNGDGTGVFDWTPDFTQSGTYDVTFFATDPSAAVDSEIVTITVNQVNLPPVITAIDSQTTTENVNLNFGVAAADPDGQIPTLSALNLPAGASLTDNGDGTGIFDWTPDFTQAGTYDVSIVATDPDLASDTELVTITVNDAGNQAPVLAPISDTTVQEAQLLQFTVSASDADGEIPTLSATGLPAGATFTDNLDGTGLFDWTPTLTQSGTYDVTFKALDAALAVDSQIVTITVVETNQPPVLATIGPQSVTENDTLVFGVSATDGDGEIPTLLAVGLPTGATFVDSLNGSGSFTWVPGFTDAGTYDVTFYASDDIAIDSEVVTITVLDAGNQAPVLDSIPDYTVAEGVNLNFVITATDADSTIPSFSAVNLPLGATLADSGDGTATFDWTPDFNSSGTYNVTFIASDGTNADSQVVTLTVTEIGNVAPVIDSIGDKLVDEGTTLTINVVANDPDSPEPPTLSINTTLQSATFVDNGDGTGVFTYSPTFFDAGSDSVYFFATDAGSPQRTGTEAILVLTQEVNQPPEWEPAGPFSVLVGDTMQFTVTATDSTDANTLHRLFLSTTASPSNSSFVDNGDGTGTFTWVPTAATVTSATFLAVDQGVPQLSATLVVDLEAVTANVPPVLDPIGPQTILEGEILLVNVSATDPDSPNPPTLFTGKLPENSTFEDNGDGTGVFTFFPNFVQSGLKSVTIKATDGISEDKEVVLIQVYEAGDQVPVFDSIPAPSVVEGTIDSFFITASDPDEVFISVGVVDGTLPSFATFEDRGDGLGAFVVGPGFTDAGTYPIDVFASDGELADTITMTLTVEEAGNQPPVLDTIPDQAGKELVPLSFSFTASDVDGTEPPLLSAAPLPAGATVNDNRNGSATFEWTPGDTQAGTYDIYFRAEDFDVAGTFDSQLVVVTIADTNRLPFITTSGSRTISEGDTLQYTVFATDPDGTIPNLGARLDGQDTLATNMVFVDSGNGVGVLTFIPDHTQGGTSGSEFYFVRFFAVDSEDPTLVRDATAPVQIEVQHANFPAEVVFFGGNSGPFTMVEGDTLEFQVGANDPDGSATPTITAQNLPANATFDGLQSAKFFNFQPDFTQAGVYTVTFIATDALGASSTADVEITVTDAGNQLPSFTTAPGDTVNVPVNTLSQVLVQAEDPDGETLTMSVDIVYTALVAGFVDSGNGSAVYSVTPDAVNVDQVFPLTFVATDASGLADTVFTNLRVVSFLRGDIDDNSKYTMNDLAWLISYIFRDGPEPTVLEAADVDKDGTVNIGDITYLIRFLYYSGPQPPQ